MDSWQIFKSAFNTGFKITTVVAKKIKVQVDAKKYRDSLNYAKALSEPSRTQVILEIVKAWKKDPDFRFANDIIDAVNIIVEPSRRIELGNLMAFCVTNKMSSAVRKISTLL